VRIAVIILAGAAGFTGCGYIGEPLPPALNIPSRVTDLRAVEFGDKILAEFTLPPLTTEGLALKSVRSVELRVGVGPIPFSIEGWAASARRFEVPATGPGPLNFEMRAREWIGKEVIMAVRATGPKGKTSDWSTLFVLPITAPLEHPTGLKAENVERGVQLTWRGTGPRYRVFRSAGDENPERLADTDQPQYLDESRQFGTLYRYLVQAISGELTQSELSERISITPMDTFPPAVPAGLTAVSSTNTIELAWERNTEPDFKGYNVYRSAEGGPLEKIASLIEAPTYSDRQIEPAKKYRYTVSAVDLTGNESQRSEVAEATAQ
jgi:hypothetical protein